MKRSPTRRKRVVILGGGFAGLAAALELGPDRHQVTLIDRSRWFEFLPNIHELLSGVKTPELLRLPLDRNVRRAGHTFVRDTVTAIDPVGRTVATQRRRKAIGYDALIVAFGGVDATRGVQGVFEHAFPFKSVEQCERIGKRLARLAARRKPARVVIVGGGLEGVEALGEILRSYRDSSLHVTLVEARERLAAGEKGVELKRADRKAAEAKDRFIRANLRLVVSVARRYPLPAGMELLDLIQEGNLGLEHAVDKFDWRKGFKFSTYATFWIRQAIGRALDQKASLVRLPGDRSASLRAALRQVSGDGDELDEEHARLHRLTTPTSLDRTIGDDDSNELVDLLPDVNPGPEQAVMEEARETMVYDLLNVLDDRARYAVEQRFGLQDGRKRSYREVGEELGVTAEAARRLVKRAVNIVRESAPDQMDIDAA